MFEKQGDVPIKISLLCKGKLFEVRAPMGSNSLGIIPECSPEQRTTTSRENLSYLSWERDN